MLRKIAICAMLTLCVASVAIPVSAAPTDVSLSPGEVSVINSLYDQIIALKQNHTSADTSIKTQDKGNSVAIKNIVAAAVPIASDVAAVDALKLQNQTLKTTNAEDITQLDDLTTRLKVAQTSKDDKQITILSLQRNRLLAILQPTLDLISANEKNIKSMEQKLKSNAEKKQQEDIKALLDSSNTSVKSLWADIKAREKEEKDALKALSDAITAGDPTAVITQLGNIVQAKQRSYALKQQIIGYQQSQGDTLRGLLTKEPVGVVSPVRYATGVSVSEQITVTFNEPVSIVSLVGITITDEDYNLVSGVTGSVSGQVLTISHAILASDKTYTVSVPNGTVKNGANVHNGAITWSFKTLP